MTTAAAHVQIELDEYLETFQSYKHRYKNDYESSYSDDQLYYSVDIGREPHIQQQPALIELKLLWRGRDSFAQAADWRLATVKGLRPIGFSKAWQHLCSAACMCLLQQQALTGYSRLCLIAG